MNHVSSSNDNNSNAAATCVTLGKLMFVLLLTSTAPVAGDEIELCDDAHFLRRASVVLTGRTPSQNLVTDFEDSNFDRSILVDDLLTTPQYGEAWGRWLAMLTGCEEEPLSTAAFAMKVPRERIFWLWQKWTQEQLNQDRSYAEIAHELISADSRSETENYHQYESRHDAIVLSLNKTFDDDGLFRQGNNDLFWKTNRSAVQNAEFIARNFLGFRLECAKCHNHPFTHWTMDDHTAFSSVFQRAVYAELPIRPTQKRTLLIVSVVAAAMVCIGLFWGSLRLAETNRFPLATVVSSMSAMVVAVGLYVTANFRHILLGSVDGQPTELAVMMSNLTGASQSIAAFALVSLLIVAGNIFRSIAIPDRPRTSVALIRNFACFVVIGLMCILTVDTAFVNAGVASRRPQTLFVVAKRTLLRSLELGGQGQQIREVYDDSNGNNKRLGVPKAIDGPQITDTARSHPRLEFADWLLQEPSHQLERNFVNRVAQRVFGQAFVTPVDDYRPDSVPIAPQHFDDLIRGFRSHHHSVKWLLKSMVMSEQFQMHEGTTGDGVVFQPRALRGEEVIASLNQFTSIKLVLADKWSPKRDNPFTCGTESPNSRQLGDRILNAAICADSYLDMPFELVSLLMMDQRFHQHLQQMADELNDLSSSTEQVIKSVTNSLWGIPLKEQQKDLLKNSAKLNLADSLWAIVNSPQFLILH